MGGRWTIRAGDGSAGWIACVDGPFSQAPVPVVPCDDAAIERAAAVLERWYGDSPNRLLIAAKVLDAAGETP